MNVWKYGDDINTDMLFPGKHTYTCSTPEEIKPHLLEDLDPTFATKVAEGDIVFAGKNFGCGSSREQPVVGLKAVGVQAIVAKSYARIFYRAAINQGLLLVECADAVDAYKKDDEVQLDAQLHNMVSRMSGCKNVEEMLGKLRARIQVFRVKEADYVTRADDALREHMNLLNAIIAKNKRAAIKSLAAHIEHTKNNVLSNLCNSK